MKIMLVIGDIKYRKGILSIRDSIKQPAFQQSSITPANENGHKHHRFRQYPLVDHLLRLSGDMHSPSALPSRSH
nr:hypothetical protein CFP56_75900 [Quercus suber]